MNSILENHSQIELAKELHDDKGARILLCEYSLIDFAVEYLGHYLSYDFAPFHLEIFEALQDEDLLRLSVLGFRESAKSAIVNTVYTLWCICYHKRNFILLGSEESGLAVSQTTAIAYELLFNYNIISDFGKLYYDEDEGMVKARKRSVNDFVCRNGIRIKAISSGMKVRGLRHNAERPDLVLVDDMDSIKSVQNERIRNLRWDWFKAELLSGMNQAYGKVVALGNMIHYDCFMARIQKEKEWTHLSFPIYKGEMYQGEILWTDKYVWTENEANELNKTRPKNKKFIAIEVIKRDKGSRVFGQEYLLVPATDEDRIFKRKFMEQCLNFDRGFVKDREVATYSFVTQGNDLAVSDKKTSDWFVITTLGLEKATGKMSIMNILREKNLSPNEQRSTLQTQQARYKSDLIYIEDNAYQAFFAKDMIENTRLPIKGFTTTSNKRDEQIGLNGMALMFENKKFDLPYGDEKSQKMIDILMEEALQYPDGHTGDVLMSLWFAWQALRTIETTPKINLTISKSGLYNR